MNELVTDVKSLELETLKNLKSSKAINTLRAYKADFKDFALFCEKNGLKSMPSQPNIITLYLTHLSKGSKFTFPLSSTICKSFVISICFSLNFSLINTAVNGVA